MYEEKTNMATKTILRDGEERNIVGDLRAIHGLLREIQNCLWQIRGTFFGEENPTDKLEEPRCMVQEIDMMLDCGRNNCAMLNDIVKIIGG